MIWSRQSGEGTCSFKEAWLAVELRAVAGAAAGAAAEAWAHAAGRMMAQPTRAAKASVPADILAVNGPVKGFIQGNVPKVQTRTDMKSIVNATRLAKSFIFMGFRLGPPADGGVASAQAWGFP
jgi:hypothetical protein